MLVIVDRVLKTYFDHMMNINSEQNVDARVHQSAHMHGAFHDHEHRCLAQVWKHG